MPEMCQLPNQCLQRRLAELLSPNKVLAMNCSYVVQMLGEDLSPQILRHICCNTYVLSTTTITLTIFVHLSHDWNLNFLEFFYILY